ncbi:MAG: 2-hydroxyacid dehydrogenase [Pseudomonadota bacterium]
MSLTDVLLFSPMPKMVEDGLDARFTVHRLWTMDDPDGFLASSAGTIRAIAIAGHNPIDKAVIDRFPNLEIIGNFGVGYDSIDATYAAERRVIVTNTPDVLTDEVADTALGLTLMTVREMGAAERYLRNGQWLNGAYPLTVGTLSGATMGIVGLGRIGKAIASRAESFGVKIAYHGRRPQEGVDYPYYDTVAGLAEAVDILMVVVPGTDATRHLIDTEVLQALGPNGVLINIGRGSVVDETALVEALRDGTIRSAGLDVFENEPQVPDELVAMDHVVLLPHVGSASIHTRNRMGQLVVDNLVSWFETGKPVTPVPESASLVA